MGLVQHLQNQPFSFIKEKVCATTCIASRWQQVDSVTYLGVHLTSDLSWASHIDAVCSRARKQLGLLYCNFYLAGPKVLTQLYKIFGATHSGLLLTFVGSPLYYLR